MHTFCFIILGYLQFHTLTTAVQIKNQSIFFDPDTR